MAYYDFYGNPVTAYSFDGQVLGGDYDVANTDYQRATLTARDAWAEGYRTNGGIPLVLTADQHGYLDSNHKATFDYLAKATNANEVSAYVNLGDVCGNVYTPSTLSAMQTCLRSLPKSKQINIAGNHDVFKTGAIVDANGVERGNGTLSQEEYEQMHSTYFDNSSYGMGHRYWMLGNETMVDPVNDVRYIVLASWYFPDLCYFHFNISAEMAEAMISMLSMTDHDLVILSHIPLTNGTHTWHYPAVDGNEEHTEMSGTGGLDNFSMNTSLNQMLSDRKHKRSGVFVDSLGGQHPYDFTGCTTDLICSIHGHNHADKYDLSADFPVIVLDAYRFDASPFYFMTIDRTGRKVDVYKVDTSNNVYTYSVPL